jgi:hypothetical protein
VEPKKRLPRKITICAPNHLFPLIENAAGRRLMTASEFIRQSVIDRLIADGLDPSSDGVESPK